MESFVMLLLFLAASVVINVLTQAPGPTSTAVLRVVSYVGILASFLGLAFLVGTTLL